MADSRHDATTPTTIPRSVARTMTGIEWTDPGEHWRTVRLRHLRY